VNSFAGGVDRVLADGGRASGPLVDVLVPTCNRPCALAMTLSALAAQTMRAIRIIVSDQSDGEGLFAHLEVLAVLRFLSAGGIEVNTWRHMPHAGMAEQRAFLLSHVTAPCCLFLDDDVLIEPDLLARLHRMLIEQRCGFVGSAVHGLSYLDELRPHQQHIEFWEGPVVPETVVPGSVAWERHHLHSAANLYHVQQQLRLTPDTARAYRVAWVGGCVLFDTAKLRAVGGFDFWPQLPAEHCGEDVLVQMRVMAQFGGCGMIPSGAYHMELPTTVTTRQVDAPKILAPQLDPLEARKHNECAPAAVLASYDAASHEFSPQHAAPRELTSQQNAPNELSPPNATLDEPASQNAALNGAAPQSAVADVPAPQGAAHTEFPQREDRPAESPCKRNVQEAIRSQMDTRKMFAPHVDAQTLAVSGAAAGWASDDDRPSCASGHP
jgi:hypothetical protein